jgi:peptidoglycan hydrolase-like protein with peptidoglycan-binding domain
MSNVTSAEEFRARYTYSPETAKLQTWLNSTYRAGLKVDGFYGPMTQAAHQRQGMKSYNDALVRAGIRKPMTPIDAGTRILEDAQKAVQAQQQTTKPQALVPTTSVIVPPLPTIPPTDPGKAGDGMQDLLKSPWVWIAAALLFLRK